MANRNGVFTVIDLGVAKHLDEKTITMFGTTPGTPGYMAPEQTRGRKNLTLRVDLFALGVVGYEALTGVHPFGYNQLLIGRIAPAKPGTLAKVSPDMEALIMQMLQPNPLYRPESGAQIITRLGG